MDRDNVDLASALQVSHISPQIFSVGPSRDLSPVYGGLLMGQAVMAAAANVGERQCHSVQATFIRRAQPQNATHFNATQDMSGNNFTMCHVVATQSDKVIFSANVSFRKPHSDFEHQQPQTIPSTPTEIETITQEGQQPRPPPAGIEVRWTQPVADANGTMELWMRSMQSLGDDPALHTAALLYASDYPILEAGLSRHGLSWLSTDLFTASLNHSAWFLRPSDFSDWHLFRIDSPAAYGGTALGRATCYDSQGNMVATPTFAGDLVVVCLHSRPAFTAAKTSANIIKGARLVVGSIANAMSNDRSDTFNQQNQQNPAALDTSTNPPVRNPVVLPQAVPLQLEFEVSEWLAHAVEASADGDIGNVPPDLPTYHQTSPSALGQNPSGTVQEPHGSNLEESQTDGDPWDDASNRNDIGFGEQPLTKQTETSDTTVRSSSHSGSEIGFNDNIMSTLFSQIFQSSSDEMTFTYYLKRVCSCTTAYDSDQNPYRKLALMALSYPVLLHGILSVSTAHMEMFGKSSRCTLYSRQSQALRSLRAALKSLHLQENQNTNQSDRPLNQDGIFLLHSPEEITLAAIVMQTSSVLMVGLSNIETHMTYALYLIQHLGHLTQPPRSAFLKTLIYRFAMVDVVLAFIQSRHPLPSPGFFMYQANNDQFDDDEEPSFREMHGCHQQVLSFLAQIAILGADLAKPGSSVSEIQAKGYDLETEMRLWGRIYYGGMAAEPNPLIRSPSEQRFNSRADLEVVCECFYWTAHILLLRRVFADDTSSTRVQLIRKHLFRLMDSLVSGCGPDSSLPFPFYIAACEATATCDQNWVRKKHAEMLAAYRDPAREALMTSVERIWAKSEAEAHAGCG
ncbi:hypothetical protein F53441_5959 [Fusarium austroafricanum]|uniref:Acyl-CoA thioesterase II n=1 Tax=Fusarium austroafricanum TaxID=2364996 RepID=A0A8H4KGX7_9HYPO|nr:hypothetical protein F53441_5959 [Fusarium austroafricanum]